MQIEWNAHMFSSDFSRYPLHSRAAYAPDQSQFVPDPLALYMERMNTEGIDRAVLVHPEPYGDDHRLVLDCLEREPGLFLGTSLYFPGDPDASQKLTNLVKSQPKIISTRFHAHRKTTAYLKSFAEDGVRAIWRTAGELGLVIELHIGPEFGAEIADIMRLYPDFPVLIDHFAEPQWGTAIEYVDILRLADFKNVYMKISGLGHFSDDAPFYADMRPFTRWVVDAFGPERLVWGSGSPKIIDTHLDHFTADERAKVRGGNLQRLLPFSA
ncbi:Amidohydro-rel domain-containing protein [Hyphomicrobiales bacterium]|nr:Amidohydro-rel domain-containing protein [Hyphomicrobiales bacterium]CAH1677627.1 Amidohydro-rel domain-containing protein [Hyphomicrobiales bacterium]